MTKRESCKDHGQRVIVIGGLDRTGRQQPHAGTVLCYDCEKPLDLRVFSVTINSYENGMYVSRRIGDLKVKS